jgi:membrane associated rhomboid family serine protease
MKNQETNALVREIKTQGSILGGFVATFWIVEIIDSLLFQSRLDARYGIVPHSFVGLRGILFAPFFHGDFEHLIANTIPFLTLGWLVMLQETSDFFVVTALTMVVGGLGIWTVGDSGTVHIGASILVFGYLGFLLFRGYFQGNLASILLSITVGVVYGGLIWGILPSTSGISWEGHLFGFIGGAIAAQIIGKKKRSRH